MGQKRIRTVEGGCWTCHKRRVICDLMKPVCQKCTKAGLGSSCNFDQRLLKWQDGVAARGHLAGKKIPVKELAPPTSDISIAERDALHYFQHDLWPKLIISNSTSPPPMTSVLGCHPLLLAICASAEAHRAMRRIHNYSISYDYNGEVDKDRGQSVTNATKDRSPNTRLACVKALRSSLANASSQQGKAKNLTAMMLTAIFLCVLDGYIAPHDEMASCTGHQLGVHAIVDALGGPEKALARVKGGELIILSEFFCMDLTRALVRGENPYLPPNLWASLDASMAFWGNLGEPESLGRIFEELSTMARHVYLYDNTPELANVGLIRRFEENLQPPQQRISVIDYDSEEVDVADVDEECRVAYGQSLVRSFRHCALIYLYRAICKLQTHHRLVQREVHLCLEAASALSRQERLQNCSLFPLCVAGAHSLADAHREAVISSLMRIGQDLGFGSVQWLRESLQSLWLPGNQDMDWRSMFVDFNEKIFVL